MNYSMKKQFKYIIYNKLCPIIVPGDFCIFGAYIALQFLVYCKEMY
jgi:hypothetical protein